jgi:cardiolipin synthase
MQQLDGYIARNFANQKSALGSILDPLADKLLVCTMFACLTYADLLPLWLTLIVFGRDTMLMIGACAIRYRSLSAPRSVGKFFSPSLTTIEVHPTTLSKANTAFQLLLVATALTGSAFPSYQCVPLIEALSWLTAITTVTSGAQYAFSRKAIRSISHPK